VPVVAAISVWVMPPRLRVPLIALTAGEESDHPVNIRHFGAV
jgi:hypothetical protein